MSKPLSEQTPAQQATAAAILSGLNGDTKPLEDIVKLASTEGSDLGKSIGTAITERTKAATTPKPKLNSATATMEHPEGQPMGAVIEQANAGGLRAAKKEQDAAKRAANKEALAGAKKVGSVLPAPVKKAPAKKAPAKATSTAKPTTAAKATAPVEPKPAKVVVPKPAAAKVLPTPAQLEWTEEEGAHVAADTKFSFQVIEGSSGGWFARLRTTKGGRWVNIAGKASTVDEAKKLAAWASAGAMWLTYAKLQGVMFENVIATYSLAGTVAAQDAK